MEITDAPSFTAMGGTGSLVEQCLLKSRGRLMPQSARCLRG